MSELSPAEVLRQLPPSALPVVEAILASAERHRLTLYLVGGPLRDLLLDRAVRDVDLVVEGSDEIGPEALCREAAPEGVRVVVHSRFGTASIETPEAPIDVTGLRKESYAHPGALPRVESGTLEDDLRRRDFSVNALALRLTGVELADKVAIEEVDEGLRDLEERRLRVLHRRSFHDDPTRALRAARLGARLGFSLSRGSRSLLRDALRDGVFGRVSGDRLRREIEKVFDDARQGLDPSQVLRRLADWHVLPALEPGLGMPRESTAPLRRLGRAIAEPPWRGPRYRPWVAGLATWLAPLPPALRRRALQRLSVRGEVAKRVAEFPKLRDAVMRRLSTARGRGAVDALLCDLDEERLYALYAWAPPTPRRRVVRWAAEDRARRVPVTGQDLLEIGLSGPAVGRALARIRAAFLDGAVANREEALALAREIGRPRGATAKRRVRRSPRRKSD